MIRLLRGFSIVALALAVVLFIAAYVVDYLNRDDTMPSLSFQTDTLEIPCNYTEEDLLQGVTAWDEKDGDLTDQILPGTFTRFLEPGVCDLSYVVFDSSDHMATASRRILFTDYHSPRFALAQPLCFADGITNHSEVRAMFSASDVLDGNLSDWIDYVDTDADYSLPGDYSITMEVRNSFGDTVSYDFPIHIYRQDTQNVSITLKSGLAYVNQGNTFEALDYVDSVVGAGGREYQPSLLRITSNVKPNTPGLYEVHYEFSLNGTVANGGQYGETWLTVIVQEVGQ